jgi:hypothetical protein
METTSELKSSNAVAGLPVYAIKADGSYGGGMAIVAVHYENGE